MKNDPMQSSVSVSSEFFSGGQRAGGQDSQTDCKEVAHGKPRGKYNRAIDRGYSGPFSAKSPKIQRLSLLARQSSCCHVATVLVAFQ